MTHLEHSVRRFKWGPDTETEIPFFNPGNKTFVPEARNLKPWQRAALLVGGIIVAACKGEVSPMPSGQKNARPMEPYKAPLGDVWLTNVHFDRKGGLSAIVCWTGKQPIEVPPDGGFTVEQRTDKQGKEYFFTRVDIDLPWEVLEKRGYTEPDTCADGNHPAGTAQSALLVVFSRDRMGVVAEDGR